MGGMGVAQLGAMAKRRKKRRPSRAKEPVHLVLGDVDDDCPLCIALKALPNAAALKTMRFVEVSLRGDTTTWPHLPLEPRTERVPEGSRLGVYIEEMLGMVTPGLFDGGPLEARVNGRLGDYDDVIRAGDEIVVSRFAADAKRC
jgi:hypothetical protein